MLVGDASQHRKKLLEKRPTAPGVDHLLVLAQAGGVQLGGTGFGLAEEPVREQATAEDAVGQQPDPLLLANCGHLHLGTPVNQRVLHLVGHHADAIVVNLPQTFGIEIGQSCPMDLALVAESSQLSQGIQVTLVAVLPPVELQQVETLDAHAPQ